MSHANNANRVSSDRSVIQSTGIILRFQSDQLSVVTTRSLLLGYLLL